MCFLISVERIIRPKQVCVRDVERKQKSKHKETQIVFSERDMVSIPEEISWIYVDVGI